ncbi:MAG: ABC transporter ATP-binding protein [Alphaproteobacteria bacterium]|nr:MAG: ABC transporter ATP-binding protein [Alphaproteobacteria bacterium]
MSKPRRLPLDSATWPLLTRLWREFLHRHWAKLAATLAVMAVVAATASVYPLLIKWVIDLYQAQDDRLLWVMPIAVLLLAIVRGTALYAQAVMSSAAVQPVIVDLQKTLFDRLLAADLAQIGQDPPGELVSRFTNDTGVVRTMLARSATGIVRDGLTVIALVATMLYLDWALSLVVLVIYPLAAIPIIGIGRRLRSVSLDTQSQVGRMTAQLDESIAGARMVKAYRLEAYERRRAHALFEDMDRLQMQMVRSRSRLDPFLEVLGALAVIGVITFGYWRATTGGGTIGDLAGFISAVLFAAQPVRAIGTLNALVQEGLAALSRLYEVIDRRPTITEAPDATPLTLTVGEVRLVDVRFRYGDRLALDGVSLTVPAGQMVALVGPSGAGKSTLFNLIPRFWDVDDGSVLIDGQDVRRVTLPSLRACIGLVSQDSVLFDDSIAANIRFGRPDASDAEVEAAARAAAAHDFILRQAEGYQTRVGPRGQRLSGGERQRIALARAILMDPPILLLDEATSALDAESERLVQDALARLARGRTTLVIAHRLATVRDCDAIAVLDQGRVIEWGNHEALIAEDGLYARMVRLQFREE